MRSLGLIVLFMVIFVSNASMANPLVPPAGYFKAVGQGSSKNFACPEVPKPFTGPLDFPSKYEGSDSARDQINPEANAEYKAQTKPIDDMEKGVSKLVDKYMETGNPAVLACTMNWLVSWSSVHALENNANDYTGMAVRKWALASISGAYVRLKFSTSSPLSGYPEQAKYIEAWLGRVADKVVSEWSTESSHKINNHYYWAAWSVMATSVILDRKDLFDWSMHIYDIFSSQVDEQGYLPYELARKSRAFGYHQFAITPLAMIAAFAKANGIDAASKGSNALSRLAGVVFIGMDNISVFETKTGVKQELDNSESVTKNAWLEPYCSVVQCPASIQQKLASWRPLRNSRLGGNVTSVFYGQ